MATTKLKGKPAGTPLIYLGSLQKEKSEKKSFWVHDSKTGNAEMREAGLVLPRTIDRHRNRVSV
jgi:hypothetical protein